MDINRLFTSDKLRNSLGNFSESEKEVQANQKTYDLILEKLGFCPTNLKVNNHIPEGQAIILDVAKIKEDEKWLNTNSLIRPTAK